MLTAATSSNGHPERHTSTNATASHSSPLVPMNGRVQGTYPPKIQFTFPKQHRTIVGYPSYDAKSGKFVHRLVSKSPTQVTDSPSNGTDFSVGERTVAQSRQEHAGPSKIPIRVNVDSNQSSLEQQRDRLAKECQQWRTRASEIVRMFVSRALQAKEGTSCRCAAGSELARGSSGSNDVLRQLERENSQLVGEINDLRAKLKFAYEQAEIWKAFASQMTGDGSDSLDSGKVEPARDDTFRSRNPNAPRPSEGLPKGGRVTVEDQATSMFEEYINVDPSQGDSNRRFSNEDRTAMFARRDNGPKPIQSCSLSRSPRRGHESVSESSPYVLSSCGQKRKRSEPILASRSDDGNTSTEVVRTAATSRAVTPILSFPRLSASARSSPHFVHTSPVPARSPSVNSVFHGNARPGKPHRSSPLSTPPKCAFRSHSRNNSSVPSPPGLASSNTNQQDLASTQTRLRQDRPYLSPSSSGDASGAQIRFKSRSVDFSETK